MSPYLFELEAPRATARRGRPAAATTNPSPVDCSSMAGSVAVGAPAVAGPSPTPVPWVLVINAPATSVTVRDKKTKTKYSKLGPAWLNMNDRIHWSKKAKITTAWQKATKTVARSVGLPVGVVTRARFDMVLRFTRTQRRDTSNWGPTGKVILDALAAGTRAHPGYGFLPDDAPKFLHCEECPHLVIGENLPAKPYGPYGQVSVTITDLSGVAA